MERIKGVLFDFHSTLIDQGDAGDWLRAAERELGRSLQSGYREELGGFLHKVWENANQIDPKSFRDISARSHRDVFAKLMNTRFPEVNSEEVGALYKTVTASWIAYRDTQPMLEKLRGLGVKTALVSNAGVDIRPVIVRTKLMPWLDAVIISGEHATVKPEPEIFTLALDAIGVAPEHALMVGDNYRDDAGAAAIGIRTLLLPRTDGPIHGLGAVIALVKYSQEEEPVSWSGA